MNKQDLINFMNKLRSRDYNIELFIESRGLAIFKQFDPYVIRVVCNRK